MENLDVLRLALADDATAEQRAAGLEACRAILVALGSLGAVPAPANTEALVAPIAPARGQVDMSQVVDLLIARLAPLAQAKQAARSTATAAPTAVPVERAQRLNIPFVPITPLKPRGGGT
jgi:hypothetical protein